MPSAAETKKHLTEAQRKINVNDKNGALQEYEKAIALEPGWITSIIFRTFEVSI